MYFAPQFQRLRLSNRPQSAHRSQKTIFQIVQPGAQLSKIFLQKTWDRAATQGDAWWLRQQCASIFASFGDGDARLLAAMDQSSGPGMTVPIFGRLQSELHAINLADTWRERWSDKHFRCRSERIWIGHPVALEAGEPDFSALGAPIARRCSFSVAVDFDAERAPG